MSTQSLHIQERTLEAPNNNGATGALDIPDAIAINVEDMTGNIKRRAAGIARDASIEELVESLAHKMGLPKQDSHGRPILYGLRTSDGDPLNPTDRIGDVLKQDDTVTLTHLVTAG